MPQADDDRATAEQRDPGVPAAMLVPAARPRHRDEVGLLSAIIETQSEIASAGLDPQSVVDVVARRAQDLTHSSGAVVELLDGEEMRYWAGSGDAERQIGLRLDATGSLSGLAAQTGEILRCDDSEADDRVDREACRRVGLRSMVVVPLRYRDAPVGVLKVFSPFPGAYGGQDVRTLQQMATLIGATIGQAVEYQADRDRHERLERERLERERRIPAERIREVIEQGEPAMVFQPIVNIRDGFVVGVEALARFHSQPLMGPDRWFAAGGEVGLGVELELAAIRAAVRAFEQLPDDVFLAVNLSPETAASDELMEVVRTLDPSRLVLEITEHAAVEDYETMEGALGPLRARGVRIAIDDAGAGYASLRHILELAPELIKLDMTLTRGIDRRQRHQSLVSALVTFAVGTGAQIVAEGIETAEELGTLQSLQVPAGQGYQLARPGPIPEHWHRPVLDIAVNPLTSTSPNEGPADPDSGI